MIENRDEIINDLLKIEQDDVFYQHGEPVTVSVKTDIGIDLNSFKFEKLCLFTPFVCKYNYVLKTSDEFYDKFYKELLDELKKHHEYKDLCQNYLSLKYLLNNDEFVYVIDQYFNETENYCFDKTNFIFMQINSLIDELIREKMFGVVNPLYLSYGSIVATIISKFVIDYKEKIHDKIYDYIYKDLKCRIDYYDNVTDEELEDVICCL